MPLTPDEFQEIVCLVCPHCRNGLVARRRENGEWCHDVADGGRRSHTLCWANGLKNSRFCCK